MSHPEKVLGSITLAPYIFKAMALIGIRRKAGSNMFRHQIQTLGVLLDYKFIDALLLKASVIHDLFEDGQGTTQGLETRATLLGLLPLLGFAKLQHSNPRFLRRAGSSIVGRDCW